MIPPRETKNQINYRPDIDGLRAIAVLSVVIFHAFPEHLKGGFIGVDIFFVISGYLITSILHNNLKSNSFSFFDFYSRRVNRLFPALAITLALSAIFGWLVLLPDELNQLGKHIFSAATFTSNIILWLEAGYFDTAAETKPLLHLWSLAVEEQFYLLWPIALWFAWARKLNLVKIAVTIAAASLLFSLWLGQIDPTAAFFLSPSRFWELLIGAFIAITKTQTTNLSLETLNPKNRQHKIKCILNNAPSLLGISIILFGIFYIDKTFYFPGLWALVPTIGAALVIGGDANSWINRTLLASKPLVWIGLISYPLYLFHWPILSFGRIIYFETPPNRYKILTIIISFVLAWLTTRFIEPSFRHASQSPSGEERFKFQPKTLKLTLILILIGLFGIAVNLTNFSSSRSFETLAVKRRDEHAIGSSLKWFEGKENWLFLGNAYEKNLAKLKLAIRPKSTEIDKTTKFFQDLASTADQFNIKTYLFIGPNKETIYPEYLPKQVTVPPARYLDFFLRELSKINNLIIYDPTKILKESKTEGLLYRKTDTHWNNRGAYVAFSGFLKTLGISPPKVSFFKGQPQPGDLIEISNLKNFPIDNEDSWDISWESRLDWNEELTSRENIFGFGYPSIVKNKHPLSEKVVWIIGDSFSAALRPFFNATFREVHYIGHWGKTIDRMPKLIQESKDKPDLIVIIRVERSF